VQQVITAGGLNAFLQSAPTLDLIPAPAANVSLNSHKITSLANGSAASDAAAFGQLPSASSPLALSQGGTGTSAGSSAALLSALGALPLAGGTVTGPLAVSASLVTTPVTLTDAATIAVNAALSDMFRVTLGGNRTLGSPSNPSDGQAIVFEVIQDGTGSRTLAYGGAYSFPSSIGTPVLSASAGFHDFLAFRYDSAATTWYCTGFVPQSVVATPATVAQGGTGDSSLTAYTLLAGGTTSTGAVQSLTAGSSGQLLMSNGNAALPGWESLDATAGDIAQSGTAAAAGSTGKPADAGHVHASPLALPADFSGFQAWTFDPGYCNASPGATTSLMYLVKFVIRASAVLTNVSVHVVTAPAGTLTASQCFSCVYDSGGTQRAITADQSGVWNTTGVKTSAFTAAYTAPAGSYYFVVNMNVSGGNGPAWRGAAGTASAFLANAGLAAASLRVATQTAVAGTPGALTLSSNVQTNASPICAVFT
jgi:hypothetical protein